MRSRCREREGAKGRCMNRDWREVDMGNQERGVWERGRGRERGIQRDRCGREGGRESW